MRRHEQMRRKEEIKFKPMFKLCFIFLIIPFVAQTQHISVEQAAFDYFAIKIFAQNYPDIKRVYYSGETEREETIVGPFGDCFQSDSKFQEFFKEKHEVVSEKIDIESANVMKFKKSSKSHPRQLNLMIYRGVRQNEIMYVYMKIYKEMHFADHYLIKIQAASRQVLEVCRTNEIM